MNYFLYELLLITPPLTAKNHLMKDTVLGNLIYFPGLKDTCTDITLQITYTTIFMYNFLIKKIIANSIDCATGMPVINGK